jgi:hypothetical protein
MKTRILLVILIAGFILESCARSMTPFEAANNPRGRKCATIK